MPDKVLEWRYERDEAEHFTHEAERRLEADRKPRNLSRTNPNH